MDMDKETGSITLKAESDWNASLLDAEYECQTEMDFLYALTLMKLEREGKEYIGSSGGAPSVSEREADEKTEFKVSSIVVVNWKDSNSLLLNASSNIISLPVSMTFEDRFFNWTFHDKEINKRFENYWGHIANNLSEHLNILNKEISINDFDNIQRIEQDGDVTVTSILFLSTTHSEETIRTFFDATRAKYALEEQKRITGAILVYAQAAIAVANMISGGFSLESPLSSIGSLSGIASIQLNEITNLLGDINNKLDNIEKAIKELPRLFAAELTKNRLQGYYEKTSGNIEKANIYLLINDLEKVLPIAVSGIGDCRTIWTALQNQAGTNPGFSACTSLGPFMSQLAPTFTYSARNNDIINNRDACKSKTFLDIPILKNVRDEMNRSCDYMKDILAQFQPKISEFPRTNSRIHNGKLQYTFYYYDESNGRKFVSRGHMDAPDMYNAPEEYEGLCYSTSPNLLGNCSLRIYERIPDGRIQMNNYSTDRRVKYPRTLSHLASLIKAEQFRVIMSSLEPGLDEVRKAFLTKTVELPSNWC